MRELWAWEGLLQLLGSLAEPALWVLMGVLAVVLVLVAVAFWVDR